MAIFDVQALVGKRVLAHLVAPSGRYWATIVGVETQYSSESEDDAINFSSFTLRLDDGRQMLAVGAELSRIEFPETPATSDSFQMPHEPLDEPNGRVGESTLSQSERIRTGETSRLRQR